MTDFLLAYGIISRWPLRARRLFLLTIPISVPLWLAAFVLAACLDAALFLGAVFLALPVLFIIEHWKLRPDERKAQP